MFLIFWISLLTFLIAFSKLFSSPIVKFLSQDSKAMRELKDQKNKIKQQLQQTAMKENYVEYVKLERKVVELDVLIEQEKKSQSFAYLTTFGVNYIIKFLLGFTLFLVVVFNRNEAVIVFSDKFNFAPFSNIISYPSKVSNSISLPFWVFINNYVFRQVAGKLNL